MKWKPVELEDKEVIDSYLRVQRHTSSEMVFSSLYIWRKAFDIRWAVVRDCLVLWFKDGENPASLRFPVGAGDRFGAAREACDYMVSIGEKPHFYGVTKDVADEISRTTDEYELERMHLYSDYVYETDSLIRLAGKKYHSKKNHLNQFKKTYSYQYLPIRPGDETELLKAYDGWAELNDKYLRCEYEAIGEVVANLDVLGMHGAKLLVDGRVVAFSLGDRLNGDTAVIHTEKADASVRGAYTAINQMFAERQWHTFRYINREDDCGIEGLRKAKQSYHPVMMIDKYKVVRRG